MASLNLRRFPETKKQLHKGIEGFSKVEDKLKQSVTVILRDLFTACIGGGRIHNFLHSLRGELDSGGSCIENGYGAYFNDTNWCIYGEMGRYVRGKKSMS
jgi:hypothetical protein